MALLPCRCLQPLHRALTWGPHNHQQGSATGRVALGSRDPSGWLQPKFQKEEAAGRDFTQVGPHLPLVLKADRPQRWLAVWSSKDLFSHLGN